MVQLWTCCVNHVLINQSRKNYHRLFPRFDLVFRLVFKAETIISPFLCRLFVMRVVRVLTPIARTYRLSSIFLYRKIMRCQLKSPRGLPRLCKKTLPVRLKKKALISTRLKSRCFFMLFPGLRGTGYLVGWYHTHGQITEMILWIVFGISF